MGQRATVDLLEVLANPPSGATLDGSQWNLLMRMARQTRSLAKLAQRVQDAGVEDQLHPRVADHLLAARVVAAQHQRAVAWEANRIMHALRDLPCDVVFLKGGAYVLAGLPAGRGRLVSDVDIMVPKPHLMDAEKQLLAHGWHHLKLDAYDQRYYRQWMHELPPLKHKDRRNVLDVHHTILPETSRLHPPPEKLFDNAVTIPGQDHPRMKMLGPHDMVLHSACHLFQDGDLAGGLRDLLDLDDLLRHFGQTTPPFWEGLVARSREMDLHRPLFYALRYTRMLLRTPVPDAVMAEAMQVGGPSRSVLGLMDVLVHRVILAGTQPGSSMPGDVARWLLYIRSHWQRMPAPLLAQHLFRKAMRKLEKPEEPKPRTQEEANVEAKRVG